MVVSEARKDMGISEAPGHPPHRIGSQRRRDLDINLSASKEGTQATEIIRWNDRNPPPWVSFRKPNTSTRSSRGVTIPSEQPAEELA